MSVITEPNNLGDLLKHEDSQFYSRDAVTVASGQSLALGTVVGIKTADGKIYALNPVAVDGTETAAGVLILAVDATGSDADGIMIARHAIVASHALVWPGGITVNQKSTAVAQLKASGILVRQGV
ncbi:MAG: head decoration protein [Magnetococcales bacterium]|nr:head decoration protein [Magnetococcales bacterium]MBF0151537.1 head decoration protein [Magnetococcales bacterium]